jgi:cell division transport system permease protein
MSKRKLDAKAFAQQKRKRRQWITFLRMCRYGINNFSRNAWLTIAATAVMTITLLIIFITVVAQNVLSDSVKIISDQVDMSIYLKTETTKEQADKITQNLTKLSNVEQVRFISAEESREQNAQKNKDSAQILEAINQATNRNPAILRIKLKNINDTSQLDQFVKTNAELKKHINPDRPPSFAGSRREAIQNLGKGTDFAQKVGIGASFVFVIISSLIVFNTIRMAIFNRKEEIQMMKLIGADRNFIRGPFVVEAIVYGVIAAILATALGLVILFAARSGLLEAGVAVQPTIDFMTMYIVVVVLGMILLGAIIGVISSLLATRKYLKI